MFDRLGFFVVRSLRVGPHPLMTYPLSCVQPWQDMEDGWQTKTRRSKVDQTMVDLYTRDCLDVRPPMAMSHSVKPVTPVGLHAVEDQQTAYGDAHAFVGANPRSFEDRYVAVSVCAIASMGGVV